jgi:hypothetical protein
VDEVKVMKGLTQKEFRAILTLIYSAVAYIEDHDKLMKVKKRRTREERSAARREES